MIISKRIKEHKGKFISLEFFPPKERETWPEFFAVVQQLKVLGPLFASVTYGAGGGTQENTKCISILTRLNIVYQTTGIQNSLHKGWNRSAAKLFTACDIADNSGKKVYFYFIFIFKHSILFTNF